MLARGQEARLWRRCSVRVRHNLNLYRSSARRSFRMRGGDEAEEPRYDEAIPEDVEMPDFDPHQAVAIEMRFSVDGGGAQESVGLADILDLPQHKGLPEAYVTAFRLLSGAHGASQKPRLDDGCAA